MRPSLKLKPLRGRQVSRRREMDAPAPSPRPRRRGQTVRLAQAGSGVGDIAEIARQSLRTARRWLNRFMVDGCAGLAEAPRSGRPPEVTPALEAFLRAVVAQSPRDFGDARPGWPPAWLAQLIRRPFQRAVTAECVRQRLAQVGGVGRRPTWTVKYRAQAQPGYAHPCPGGRCQEKKGWITRRLNPPPRGADLDGDDEAELSLFPTLTRLWTLRGQPRTNRAPGATPPMRHEYGAVDWRPGDLVQSRAPKRDSAGFCRLVEKCRARSAGSKRRVVMVVDGAKFHRPETSRRVRAVGERYGRRLKLVFIPQCSPEGMPMEHFWNDWRDHVAHNPDRTAFPDRMADSDRYLRRRRRNPQAVLRTLGSPFARRQKCKT